MEGESAIGFEMEVLNVLDMSSMSDEALELVLDEEEFENRFLVCALHEVGAEKRRWEEAKRVNPADHNPPGEHADMTLFEASLTEVIKRHLDASTGIQIRRLLKAEAKEVKKGGYCLGHHPTSLKGTTIRPD